MLPLRRILTTGAITFLMSVGLSLLSKGLLGSIALALGLVLLLGVILIGILFDILGVAATAATEAPFHAMAADKVRGAPQAIWLVRNADRVGSFSNDMVGDVAGTLSGAMAATIVFQLVRARPELNEAILSTLVLALVAALTVGGKAAGKAIAIRHANDVVFTVGRILAYLEVLSGRELLRAGRRRNKGEPRRVRSPHRPKVLARRGPGDRR